MYGQIKEDLQRLGVFQLTAEEVPYYLGYFFESKLQTAFGDAQRDMVDAGKCFAVNQYTATVFHLMRVIEVGLREFAKYSKVTVPTNASWGAWLKACRDAKADADVVARLHTIKDGWRNKSMHVGAHYGRDRAEELLMATRSFMRGVRDLIS